MDNQELIDKLKKIVKPYVKDLEAFENLTAETNFIADLKINSANLVDVILDVEDEFDITDERGKNFAVEFLDHIRAKMVEFQEETGHLYNLEATPAEGTTYRFAREDQKRFKDILQAGTHDRPYYTNSSQLPVGYTDDPFLALEMQEELQKKYTGGTVLHLYVGERLSSAEACKMLVKRSLEGFRLPYITISPTFSICPEHGYLDGEQVTCPHCSAQGKDQLCEVWTRVMGYHRPVSLYNIGKKQEYADRKNFKTPRALTAQ